MNLETARTFVRQFARNAADESQYSNADIDRAIQAIHDDFILKTRYTRTLSTLSILDATSTLSFSALTNFQPEFLIRAYISTEGTLSVIGHDELVRLQVEEASEGVPEKIAFSATTAAHLWPTPDANYTLSVLWSHPLTTFALGIEAASGVTLPLPDFITRQILVYGATALLQHTEIEVAFGSRSWQLYTSFRDSMTGRGGLGAKSFQTQPVDAGSSLRRVYTDPEI